MKTPLRLVCVLSILFPVVSRAAALVDNFVIVTQTIQLDGGRRAAQPFQTTNDAFTITDMAFAASSQYSAQEVAVKIYDNDFSFRPNLPIVTLYSGAADAGGFNSSGLVAVMLADPVEFSNLNLQLQPNTIYWLVVENHSGLPLSLGYTGVQGSAPAQGEGYLRPSKVGLGLTDTFFATNNLEYSARIGAVPEPSPTVFLVAAALVCLGPTRFGRHGLRQE